MALVAADNAAIVVVAQTVKLGGIGHGQRLEHHGVDQGEYGRVRADSERQSEHCGECEPFALQKLP